MIDWWLSIFALFVLFLPPIAPFVFFAPLPITIAPKGVIPLSLRTTALDFQAKAHRV